MERQPRREEMFGDAEQSEDASKPIEIPSAAKAPEWTGEKPSDNLAEQLEPAAETPEGKKMLDIADETTMQIRKLIKEGEKAMSPGDVVNIKDAYLERIHEEAPGIDDDIAIGRLKATLQEAHDVRYGLGDLPGAASIDSFRRGLDPRAEITTDFGKGFMERLKSGEFSSPDQAQEALNAERDPMKTLAMEAKQVLEAAKGGSITLTPEQRASYEDNIKKYEKFADEAMTIDDAIGERYKDSSAKGTLDVKDEDLDASLDSFFDQTGT